MATDLENLRAAKSRILAELAAGPMKPSYNLEGQAVSWTEYRASLVEQVRNLNELIVLESGNAEIITEGVI